MLRSVLPLLVFLGTAALQQTDTWTRQEHKYGRQNNELNHNKDFCSWKCLKFTLQWPGGFCMSLERWSSCKVPQNIIDWTIHGLWPLRTQFCCDCWPMFPSDVKELDAELSQQWPSLLHSKSSFHFWREEWHKHGACAACVEGMNSPLLYFHISLKLRQLFDFSKVLDEAGIRPSCTQPYKLAEVHSVLAPLLGDYHQIECVTDDKRGVVSGEDPSVSQPDSGLRAP
ncbi:ribonuclease T2-like isoform 3-T4 [Polymixia lowei]